MDRRPNLQTQPARLYLFICSCLVFRCRAMLFSYYITHRHQSVCPSILPAYTLVPGRIYCWALCVFPLFDTVVRVLMFPVEIYCYALRNKMRLLSGAPPAPRLPPGDPWLWMWSGICRNRHSTDDDCLFTSSKLDLYHQVHELLCQLLQKRFF